MLAMMSSGPATLEFAGGPAAESRDAPPLADLRRRGVAFPLSLEPLRGTGVSRRRPGPGGSSAGFHRQCLLDRGCLRTGGSLLRARPVEAHAGSRSDRPGAQPGSLRRRLCKPAVEKRRPRVARKRKDSPLEPLRACRESSISRRRRCIPPSGDLARDLSARRAFVPLLLHVHALSRARLRLPLLPGPRAAARSGSPGRGRLGILDLSSLLGRLCHRTYDLDLPSASLESAPRRPAAGRGFGRPRGRRAASRTCGRTSGELLPLPGGGSNLLRLGDREPAARSDPLPRRGARRGTSRAAARGAALSSVARCAPSNRDLPYTARGVRCGRAAPAVGLRARVRAAPPARVSPVRARHLRQESGAGLAQ